MLRIILLIGNVVAFVLSVSFFSSLYYDNEMDPTSYFVFISLIVLLITNIYFLIDPSLYFKRKRLEEKIKIQEAENKLQKLQSQGLDSLKEKMKAE